MVTEGNACGAISWYFVRFPGFFQEIATAFGLAMTVVVGRWCGFARGRWLIRCIPRNAGDGVPYGANRRATPPGVAASAPLRVGATLAVVPGPTVTSLHVGKLRLTDILNRIPNVFYR